MVYQWLIRLVYSRFTPTRPIFLSPRIDTASVAMLSAKQYQNVALYPVINASGPPFSGNLDFAVTLLAITALVANPTDFPICATVLNTPPASACVFAGKTDVMSKFEIVNSVSAPTGLRNTAKNEQLQYVQSGFTIAISSGAMHVMTVPTKTAQSARTRWTIKPMTMLERAPEIGAGRKRIEVSMALISCTYWKKRVRMLSTALKAP
jgi:hypothetical protein